MSAILDARTLPAGTVLTPDLAIIGGGPAGIALALALADSGHSILLLESGGMVFDSKVQSLYAGGQSGVPYTALDGGRLRFLGGSTNHWGGWCRPLEEIVFEKRDWVPHSGWPFARKEIEPYFARAQALVEAGTWIYDAADQMVTDDGPILPLGKGGVYTSWFQFSKTRGDILPTHFGERYQEDLKRAAKVTPLFHANVTGIRLTRGGGPVDHLDVATLNGAGAADKHFTVRPRYVVLACGGMESARLLLASNDVMKPGIGNQNDLVGRFFADTPIPRDTATMVLFDGPIAGFYSNALSLPDATILRATFAPSEEFARRRGVIASLTTVENPMTLDALGTAAVVATAQALGVDASNAKAYSLGCGLELAPDPDRRLTLSDQRDALGMPRLNLLMKIADSDFEHYHRTIAELGRQMLAARSGMIKINYNRREQWLAAMDWGNHHMGTTRMSDDPKNGVVDAQGQVFGVPNLYVAGSSVFPTYGASNPTLNLLALTLRLGDHLKKVMA
ncbi:MAG TPA: FAD-dependent oxidoreductase [Rhizomicrobium sp.]|nr:FAD-dependent oxidoreductase [Rhizomicrobium sp.]